MAPSVAPPPKRRRVSPPPQSAPPTPLTSGLSTPSPAPLSAVAARKAAQAASAATSAAPTDAGNSSSDEEAASETEEVDLDDALSSASSEEDIAAGDEAARKRIEKKRRKAAAAAQAKVDGKQKGRYFAGESAGSERKPLKPQEEVMDVDENGRAAEFQKAARVKMGRGKRQRREKSAFTDPLCKSSFTPTWGQNVYRYNPPEKDGQPSFAGVLFCLETGETLVIHGAYTVSPVFGSISALSSTIASSGSAPPLPPLQSHQVFAPSSHPLPILQARQLPLHASSPPLLLPDGTTIDLSTFAAVILIRDLHSGIETIEKVLRNSGLGIGNGMWESSQISRNICGQSWNLVVDPIPSLTSIRHVESWQQTLRNFDRPSGPNVDAEDDGADRAIFLVEGPKRVGKSTFAKDLLNKLLSRYDKVAYLDTDLGQPEFTTPGFVSLNVLSQPVLGPSFTHLSLALASHYLGSLSPASNPSGYVAAVNALLSTYAHEVEYTLVDDLPSPLSASQSRTRKIRDRVPLVINTQGWVKGLGADLLTQIKEASRPTHIFTFDTEEDGRDVPELRPHGSSAQGSGAVQTFKMAAAPSSPLESKWSAADLRTLAFISYFHAVFPDPSSISTESARNAFPLAWDFHEALVSRTPLAVNWSKEAQQVEAVHILEDEVAPELVLHALNASMVAIVSSVASEQSSKGEPLPFPYSPSADAPSPTSSKALGLALIRSISPASTTLHLLTPVPSAYLTEPVSLVKGAIELPLPLWLDFQADDLEREKGVAGVEWTKVPYLDVDGGDGGRKRVRRNLMRRGQN